MRSLVKVAPIAFGILSGCASLGPPSPRPPTPAEITTLESRALRDSGDVELRLRLAAAYRRAGRLDVAQGAAERALASSPEHWRAALLAGLVHEDRGEYRAAREDYGRAVSATGSPRIRSELTSRLVLLQRRETQAHVKDALAREAELAGTPPRPRTVAVFPLAVSVPDSVIAPLGRALTAMLITDLARTDRLTVLDRTTVQMLADEIRLAELGYVDERTAARGGRLLGAERIVQGSLAPDEKLLRVEASVVLLAAERAAPAAPGAPEAGAPAGKAAPAVERATRVSEADRLEALFELEKRLALKVYAAAGVELAPSERAAVTARPTESLQAMLAYGHGLLASDGGDLAAALRHFSDAARIDPGFALARAQVSTTRAMVSAGRVTTDQLAAAATGGGEGARASPAPPLLPFQRDAVAELIGKEGAAAATILELVIRRPGGAQ